MTDPTYTENATILLALFAAFMVSLGVCELVHRYGSRLTVYLRRWLS